MDIVDQLVDILLDKNASISERDDAAMDLYKFDDNRALKALITVAMDVNEDPMILDSCGESIVKIWNRRNKFDISIYKQLHPKARDSALSYIEEVKPEWMVYFNKDKK